MKNISSLTSVGNATWQHRSNPGDFDREWKTNVIEADNLNRGGTSRLATHD